MTDFGVKIKDWWAVEAMIASYNYAYQVAYKTKYWVEASISVTQYGSTHIVPYHYKFQALSSDPHKVNEAIRNFPLKEDEKYILHVFHALPNAPELKAKYQSLGYEFIRTGPILSREIPAKRQRNKTSHIQKADTIRKAEFANESLTDEGERIPLDTLPDKNIHNYYAKVAERAVGWAQLVTVYPNVAYLHHVYTLSMYRGLKIGSALIEYAQAEAVRQGVQKIVTVVSDLAMGMTIRLAYRPLAYFTALRPRDD